MIRTIAFLCLVAGASAFFGTSSAWDKDLRVRYSLNPFSIFQNKAFMQQPQSIDSAKEAGYVQVTRPDGPAEFSSLDMWCPQCDYTVCILYDDTGFVAGVQIALDVKRVTDHAYDWKSQGFTNWTTEIDGKIENFYASQAYFISRDYLTISADARIAARDPNKMVNSKFIYVSGFNGELYAISTNATDITNPETSDFTKQACTPGMGDHYYYNMTEDLECNALTLFPYFVLVYKGQVVGIGLVIYAAITIKDGCTNYWENPFTLAVKLIVPRGPQCMYNLVDSPGRITMHFYFIHNPIVLTCLD